MDLFSVMAHGATGTSFVNDLFLIDIVLNRALRNNALIISEQNGNPATQQAINLLG